MRLNYDHCTARSEARARVRKSSFRLLRRHLLTYVDGLVGRPSWSVARVYRRIIENRAPTPPQTCVRRVSNISYNMIVDGDFSIINYPKSSRLFLVFFFLFRIHVRFLNYNISILTDVPAQSRAAQFVLNSPGPRSCLSPDSRIRGHVVVGVFGTKFRFIFFGGTQRKRPSTTNYCSTKTAMCAVFSRKGTGALTAFGCHTE